MLRKGTATVFGIILFAVAGSIAQGHDPARIKLGRTLPEIRLDNVAISDAIEFLRDTTQANIHVDWAALATVNVAKDTSVSAHLRSVPLSKVLTLLLNETGVGDALTFYIDEGVIEITTRAEADKKVITRVYPIDDLIMDVPDFTGPDLDLSSSSSSGGNGGRGNGSSGSGSSGGTPFTQSTTTDEKAMSKTERAEEIIKLITETIRPEVWRDNGGTATIKYFRGSLIITAPRAVQEAIGGPVD